MNDIYKRIAHIEAVTAGVKDGLTETLFSCYERACANRDREEAADYARRIRNRMLEESDSRMAFDRLGLSAPSGSTFSAWLSFLRGLGSALTGEWSKYRQQLRDIPAQSGFPFDIEFPQPPSD